MKARSDLIEAVGDIAEAAFELAEKWASGETHVDPDALFAAVRRFNVTYHTAVATELRVLGEAVAGADTPTDGSPSVMGGTKPIRFDTALKIVDLGVFDPAIIAREIIAACDELLPEDDLPAFDSAVRLMASQLAWVCEAAPCIKASDELIFECVRRSLRL